MSFHHHSTSLPDRPDNISVFTRESAGDEAGTGVVKTVEEVVDCNIAIIETNNYHVRMIRVDIKTRDS